MHSKKNVSIYSLGSILVLFSLTLGVFVFTGFKKTSANETAETRQEESAESQSDNLSSFTLPYEYLVATYQQMELMAEKSALDVIRESSLSQNSTETETTDDEMLLTASVDRGSTEGLRSENDESASAGQITSYMYVNANELNVRSGVGTDFDKLTTLKRGDKVGLISMDGDWAKIQTESGITGYTVAKYLVDSADKVGPETPVAYWYINANELNVRSGPGTEYEKIETLKRGDKIGYYSSEGEWARVLTPSGKKGYMLMKYLVESESEVERTSSLPVAQSGAVTSLTQQIVEYSKNFLGVKYRYGGYSTGGFDCSGFVKYVYAHFGINVPRSSAEYAGFGKRVSRDNLRPSDILLFDTDGGNWDVSHVGIYIGGDKFIHASTTKGKVVIQSLSGYPAPLYGIRRVID